MVSVIYVNWNTRRLLEGSLISLRAATNLGGVEVIVVDNGSTDGTVEWLRRDWPFVNIVRLDHNVGFSVGNNIGVSHSTGEFLLLLNTDTILRSSTVSGLTRVLESSPDVGCAGARHVNVDGSLQRSMDSFPNLEADLMTLTELHRLGCVASALRRRHAWWSDHDQCRDVDWVNGACIMVRRSAFEAVDGFDPRFFIYGEEVDLCKRISERGWRIVFTPEAEVVHLGGAAMDHVAIERLCLKHEGLLRFYDKHRSIPSRLAIRGLVIATIACRALAVLLMMSLKGRATVVDRAWSAITQLGPQSRVADAFRAWSRIGRSAVRFHS